MNKYIFFLLSLLLFNSCKKEEQLTRINYYDMRDMVVDNELVMPDDVEYYDRNGKLLSTQEKDAMSNDLLYADWFINDKNTLRKVVFKDPETASLALKKEPVFRDINKVDCSNLNSILERVYDLDQENRTENLMDEELDLNNLKAVEQIIEKCGMPTLETAGDKGMSAVWLVIQHASSEKRMQYFPQLLEAAKNGDLERQDIALMQDRMLMDSGKPQLYGSQISMNADGTYELYDLKDPETVDARRKIVGLGPLSEYVSYWGLSFDVKQVEE